MLCPRTWAFANAVDSLLLLRLISRRLDDVRDDDNNDALERERKSVVVVRVKMDKESAFSATKIDVGQDTQIHSKKVRQKCCHF